MATSTQFSTQAAATLRDLIDCAAASSQHPVPAVNVIVVSKTGETMFEHAAGEIKSINGSMRPAGIDDTFALASCTKLFVCVGLMQQIERQKIDLDDSEIVERLLPDLTGNGVLTGFRAEKNDTKTPIMQARKSPVTLRMLINHTAGLGYSLFNELLWQFLDRDFSKVETRNWDSLAKLPFVSEPGTKWEYGCGVDWAAVLLERLTGQTLHEHLNAEIFTPLGLKNTLFTPHLEPQHLKLLVPRHIRLPDGSIMALPAEPPKQQVTDVKNHVHAAYSGAGNLLSSARDYSLLIAALLNNGTSPTTKKTILSPASVKLLFTSSLPAHLTPISGQISSSGVDIPASTVSSDFSEGDKELTWGLAGALQGSDKVGGRRKGTGYWMGIWGTEWWADFESGLGVVVFGSSLPFMDPVWKSLVGKIERAVYAGLQ